MQGLADTRNLGRDETRFATLNKMEQTLGTVCAVLYINQESFTFTCVRRVFQLLTPELFRYLRLKAWEQRGGVSVTLDAGPISDVTASTCSKVYGCRMLLMPHGETFWITASARTSTVARGSSEGQFPPVLEDRPHPNPPGSLLITAAKQHILPLLASSGWLVKRFPTVRKADRTLYTALGACTSLVCVISGRAPL